MTTETGFTIVVKQNHSLKFDATATKVEGGLTRCFFATGTTSEDAKKRVLKEIDASLAVCS
jgi:hypothetical protein